MPFVDDLLILLAGLAAGVINTIVGSGTLITFPTLVAFGVPPVVATMSNALGMIPGNIAGSVGYRAELKGQGRRLGQLLPASLLGALVGAWLLLHLPETAFEAIVPVLIVLALVMVVAQPALQRTLRRRHAHGSSGQAPPTDPADGAGTGTGMDRVTDMGRGRIALIVVLTFLTGVYGGYFTAAQGILLLGFYGVLLPESLQRINGLKNVLVLAVNAVAAAAYVIVGWERLDWVAAGLIAVGSLIGGSIGARIGRRLSPVLLRCLIVALGLVALVRIVLL